MTLSKPPLTNTVHILPFDKLSPLDFERLCLWLAEREGYVHAEHLGLAGSEQGRDVVAYKPAPGGDELWYFQCKRYASIRAKTLKDEVDKYLALVEERPELSPSGVVFVVSCVVSASTRDAVGKYCKQYGLAYEFWALTELDMRVKQYPDLLGEFFGLQTFSSRPKVYHNLPQPDDRPEEPYLESLEKKEIKRERDKEDKVYVTIVKLLESRFQELDLRRAVFVVLGPGRYEDLTGQTFTERVISFVEKLKTREKIGALVEYIEENRPDIDLLELGLG